MVAKIILIKKGQWQNEFSAAALPTYLYEHQSLVAATDATWLRFIPAFHTP